MWIRDCLNLLGAKFKGRAEQGYECYVYTLPGGLEVTVGPREKWWCEQQQGEGHETFWSYCYPKVEAWKQERDRKAKAEADKSNASIHGLIGKLVEHLKANDWGEIEVRTPDIPSPYPPIQVKIDGRCEVDVQFDEHGKIFYGCVVNTSITGLPSLKKQLKRRYEFEG